MTEAGPEDQKIITLARSARVRARAAEGAAVRDTDGRTYAAATVELATLRLSALQLAVAMAVSSGVQGLEAAAVAGATRVADGDLDLVREVGGGGLSVFCADSGGTVVSVATT